MDDPHFWIVVAVIGMFITHGLWHPEIKDLKKRVEKLEAALDKERLIRAEGFQQVSRKK